MANSIAKIKATVPGAACQGERFRKAVRLSITHLTAELPGITLGARRWSSPVAPVFSKLAPEPPNG